MPEDTTSATSETETTSETTTEQTDESKPTETVEFWKQKAREQEKRAKANADAAKRLAEFEESQKTEAQRLADQLKAAEKERDDARLEALRVKVGAAKKLPADVVDLLKGDTEEELAAHADRLAEHFKQAVRPSGSVDQGQRGTATPASPAQEFADFMSKQLNQSG